MPDRNPDLFFMNVLPSDDRREAGDPRAFLDAAIDASASGDFRYTLITVGARRLDPWTVAHHGMARNPGFSPLIAINPAYQHPVECAKRAVSLLRFFPNRIALNFVTGSFATEMHAIGDDLSFADRCERLREHVQIVQSLLSERARADSRGRFCAVAGAQVLPAPARREGPAYFLSGSLTGAQAQFAVPPFFVRNIRPSSQLEEAPDDRNGLGIGIVARPTQTEAENAAKTLFPEDRKGEMLFEMGQANQATPWNQWLRGYMKSHPTDDPDYYLDPLRRFQSSAPYVVGSYETVAKKLRDYASLGYRFFLVDFHPGDASHVSECIRRCTGRALRG